MTDDARPRYVVAPGNFTTATFGPTPSQTVGPFWHIGLCWSDGPDVVVSGTAGSITVAVTVLDGVNAPVTDAMVETWQADLDGKFATASGLRTAPLRPRSFRGFGRAAADLTGTARVQTVKPGAVRSELGSYAPYIDISIFARGMLDRVVTRLYFPDDTDAHEEDPLLMHLSPIARTKLIATRVQDGFAWTVHLQDGGIDGLETPFLALQGQPLHGTDQVG
ncbi:protocatechuate 3,4-dioxygenase subunit alpha [Nocardia sp. NPDC052278]|uniref:protocatechuate 3,4-dioxygenase subunit alpha n=1 Tax=unclassified Nocardia TaxID=2637762 RepID=UPI003696DF16